VRDTFVRSAIKALSSSGFIHDFPAIPYGIERVVCKLERALTPVGNNAKDYWNGLIQGTPALDFITLFDAGRFKQGLPAN